MGKLEHIFTRSPSIVEQSLRVCDMVTESGGWNLERIANLLPNTIIHKIQALPGPASSKGDDCITRSGSRDGYFSNKFAYISLLDPAMTLHHSLSKQIWRWNGPERHKMHLWNMSQGALVTNEWLQRRGLTDDDSCPICSNGEESLTHLFRDYHKAKEVWHAVANNLLPLQFFTGTFLDWIELNLHFDATYNGFNWAFLFGVVVQCIWWRRNEKVFRQTTIETGQMVRKILAHASVIQQSFNDSQLTLISGASSHTSRDTHWITPPQRWLKLNSDGAVGNMDSKATCGGVIRNADGGFLVGFATDLEPCSITEAGLHGILKGLKLAQQRNFRNILVWRWTLSWLQG